MSRCANRARCSGGRASALASSLLVGSATGGKYHTGCDASQSATNLVVQLNGWAIGGSWAVSSCVCEMAGEGLELAEA
jgi:hypothetical protein